MTELKVGDRVRVTIEDEVKKFWPAPSEGGTDLALMGGTYICVYDNDKNITVEKIAPKLPTTPGSVIRMGGSESVRVRVHGGWIHPEYPESGPFPDHCYPAASVMFDAGAS